MIDHGFRIEYDEVSSHTLLYQTTVPQAEGLGRKSSHLMYGVFQGYDPLLSDEFP